MLSLALHVSSSELSTCMQRRSAEACSPASATKACIAAYTAPSTGFKWFATSGSSGLSSSTASRIHCSFSAVAAPSSCPNCCTSDSSTPWESLQMPESKMSAGSTCWQSQTTICTSPRQSALLKASSYSLFCNSSSSSIVAARTTPCCPLSAELSAGAAAGAAARRLLTCSTSCATRRMDCSSVCASCSAFTSEWSVSRTRASCCTSQLLIAPAICSNIARAAFSTAGTRTC
mmetsp:Transcript_6170/g.22677  ORF Transcript_6170/g.22677 Transcript_6170/m.22677 type:complete len:232 (+) Transcript_6170:2877-3572(+)